MDSSRAPCQEVWSCGCDEAHQVPGSGLPTYPSEHLGATLLVDPPGCRHPRHRNAAIEADVDYGNQDITSLIYCFRLNSKLEQLERGLYLDLHSVDSAIAEVDGWHAEIDDRRRTHTHATETI